MLLSEYDPITGLLTGTVISASTDEDLLANTDSTKGYLPGRLNKDLCRVNTTTGELIHPTQAQQEAYFAKLPNKQFWRWDVMTFSWVDPRPLATYKETVINAVTTEGVRRLRLMFPSLTTLDEIRVLRELYLSVAQAARTPTPNMTRAIAIWQAGQDAVAAINAAADRAAVDAVVVAWPT